MLSKEEFREYMEVIIKSNEYLDKLHDVGIDCLELLDNINISSKYIKLLEKAMDLNESDYDEYGYSDISYFLYELDCGKLLEGCGKIKSDISK